MHGHSKQKNVFMYGCNDRTYPTKTRLYPYIMSKVCPYFSFEDSKYIFNISKVWKPTFKRANGPNVLMERAQYISNIYDGGFILRL
jgi:hypothetical protein